MGIRNTLQWAKTEWGIFAHGQSMTAAERVRWVRQWLPFGLRTIGYGTLSLTLGPLTRDHAASSWAAQQWSRSSTRGLGIDIQTQGLEHLPAGAYVCMSNHQSLLDVLVLGAVLPGDFRWAAKRALMNIPFVGWHLRLAGHVPVDRRKDKATALGVIDRFERVLRSGKPLLVFPEGTRSDTGEIQPFKDGGFCAAVRAAVPVVPVAVEGTYRLMGKHAVDTGDDTERHARVVRVQIGAALDAKLNGEEAERVADLRDRARAKILEMHGSLVRASTPAELG